jgi:hypothetical protein
MTKRTRTRTRTPEETWDAIRRQAESEEIERFLKKSSAEVDASLRASGHDPAAVRAEGEAFVKKLQADRDRLAWQAEAAAGLAKEQARFEARVPKYAGLPRRELDDLLAAARKSPRFAQPVAVMFRNRKPEEASDEEVRAILEEIDALGDDVE